MLSFLVYNGLILVTSLMVLTTHWFVLCARAWGCTRGEGSNWETTWWRKTARWAGRDFSESILWKQLHSPLIWGEGSSIRGWSRDSKIRHFFSRYLFLWGVKVVVFCSNDLRVNEVRRAASAARGAGVLCDTIRGNKWDTQDKGRFSSS